jgi:RNA polymerase sigma-70 factor (ECF subfamily)
MQEVKTRAPQPASAPPDPVAALVERARAGDAAARDALVRAFLDDVYRACLRQLGDTDLAQDAAQDTFVQALAGLSRFRGEASFRTWLLRIAVNAATSLARRRSRRREVALEDAGPLRDWGRDPGDAAVDRVEAGRVATLVQRLPPKQRTTVMLRIEHGLDYDEIARVMDSTPGAARVNYHLGVKRLREWLE